MTHHWHQRNGTYFPLKRELFIRKLGLFVGCPSYDSTFQSKEFYRVTLIPTADELSYTMWNNNFKVL